MKSNTKKCVFWSLVCLLIIMILINICKSLSDKDNYKIPIPSNEYNNQFEIKNNYNNIIDNFESNNTNTNTNKKQCVARKRCLNECMRKCKTDYPSNNQQSNQGNQQLNQSNQQLNQGTMQPSEEESNYNWKVAYSANPGTKITEASIDYDTIKKGTKLTWSLPDNERSKKACGEFCKASGYKYCSYQCNGCFGGNERLLNTQDQKDAVKNGCYIYGKKIQ